MKKSLLNIVLILLPFQILAQFDICDSLVIQSNQTLFDIEGINNTFDYVKKYHPQQYKFVSNRYELENLSLIYNLDSSMTFWDGMENIKIIFNNKSINSEDVFYPKSKDELYSKIREYGDGLPFGIISEDTTVSYIKEIHINDVSLPESSFCDLMNPNRFETVLTIKPIEVFKSSCGEYYYIYIFGKPNDGLMTFFEAVQFSYMAKIIVSKNGNYINRIVISGSILHYFGFGNCPFFVGF